MPLLILCGIPGSGKTTRSNQLKDFIEATLKKQVVIINEESLNIIKKVGYQSIKIYFFKSRQLK